MVLALSPRKRVMTVDRSLNAITLLGEDSVLDLDDAASGFSIAVKNIFD